MKKTLTLPESDILALDTAAKKYGTVELAIAIGISKTQLYEIIKGRNNKVTEESARKIKGWLDMDMDGLDKKTEKKSNQEPTSKKSVSAWDSPEFLRIAVVKVAEAISQGRLKNVRIAINGGLIPCGD